jgi:outer membrane protein OmpA-like peptidoglycan-associated protein
MTTFRAARRLAGLLPFAVAASLPLTACSVPDSVNPVEWYRDASGLSKNDPGPDAPNSKNLEAGGQQDYPTLASVPPAPTQALSTEEREALTQHLVADRANAKYIDEQLRVGPASAAAPPPAPAAVAKSSPAPLAVAAAAPPAAPQAPAPQAATPPAAPAAATPPTEVAEAKPQESTLTSPEVQNLPQPEAPRAAPPPPPADLVAGGQAADNAPAPPSRPAPAPVAAVPAPAPQAPAPARAPAQVASLPPAAPAPAAARNAAAPVAQITFASNSTRLSAADQRTLDEVVPMQQRSGGAVRVVGYAPEGRGGVAQQLASFKMALDRANAVAAALREAGVEPNRILVEAAPPTPETGVMAQRAEIFLVN